MKKLITFIPFLFLFLHILYAEDGPNQWSQSLTGAGQIWALEVNPVNPQIIYAGSYTTGVYKTTNGGTNWTQINNGLTNTVIQCLAISKTNPNIILAGTTNGGSSPGVYKSTDAGANWTLINSGITDTTNIQDIEIDPTNSNVAYIAVFTGTGNSTVGLFKTTNGGQNWFSSNSGIGTIKNILSIAINPLNPNVVYCGTSFQTGTSTGPSKIYKSFDAGVNWVDYSTGLPSATTEINPVRAMSISTADTSVVLAGLFMNTTNGGAYVSTNGGALWTKRHTGLPTPTGTLIRAAIIRPGTTSEFFVGLDGGTMKGVYRSLNAGNSWTDFNGGSMLSSYTVRALNFEMAGGDTTIYAGVGGTVGMGVHEYTWIPVGISNETGTIPDKFRLYQNYPNPFNPVTKIKFVIPADGKEKMADVKLVIFDILGKEIVALVNEQLKPGTYEVEFNGSDYPSGIYFCRLIADEFTDVGKMILVK